MKEKVVYVSRVVGRFLVVFGDGSWIRKGMTLTGGGRTYLVIGVQKEKRGAKIQLDGEIALPTGAALWEVHESA